MVRAKKIFGQHFLNDEKIAERIVNALSPVDEEKVVLEVGPGKGVLTELLIERFPKNLYAVEIDRDLFGYLSEKYPAMQGKIFNESILKFDFREHFDDKVVVIGNFPYNISSQIVFKVIEHKDSIPEMVGMFQKEMAKRIVADPGTKDYGIISVFVQCYYDREYLFEVGRNAFNPPPKVESAVIKLKRNDKEQLPCDEQFFKQVVKTAFNQRRKKLRNSLKGLMKGESTNDIYQRRPEELSLEEFIQITNEINEHGG